MILGNWSIQGAGLPVPILGTTCRKCQLLLHNRYRIAHQSKDMVSKTSAGRTGAKMLQIFVISPYFIFLKEYWVLITGGKVVNPSLLLVIMQIYR